VYFWSFNADREQEEGVAFWVDLPTQSSFPVLNLKWNKDGSKLILSGRDSYCVCGVHFDAALSKAVLSSADQNI
jgi:hypothetical protein